ncbi:phospholipid-transporting ATPase 2-like [Aristolochia californica]|uniref:phospholipid-transporting ATPase 2-like n=1 Tax=Aristolochia californica TaxID=171875 RepID=UPI0035DF33F2
MEFFLGIYQFRGEPTSPSFGARQQWYALYPEEGPWYELLIIPLQFELLCSDFVTSLCAKFKAWDDEMYDTNTNSPYHAANTAISEDLGQVEYILTDQIGTLTKNRIIFHRCCINGKLYGNEVGDAINDVELLDAVATYDSEIVRFVTVMAICNTVIPLKSNSGAIIYKAQSQDEEALVKAAACLHMVLFNRNGNFIEVTLNGSIIQYEFLDTLAFPSDRKRMSVVIKDCQNGTILKGQNVDSIAHRLTQ